MKNLKKRIVSAFIAMVLASTAMSIISSAEFKSGSDPFEDSSYVLLN